MCLAPKLTLPAAPAPAPTALDRGVLAARDLQRKRQKMAGGYNATLLTGSQPMAMPSPMKTLLGA